MRGFELFGKYGEPILGPWEDQSEEVRAAWEQLAAEVSSELAKERGMHLDAEHARESWREVRTRADAYELGRPIENVELP